MVSPGDVSSLSSKARGATSPPMKAVVLFLVVALLAPLTVAITDNEAYAMSALCSAWGGTAGWLCHTDPCTWHMVGCENTTTEVVVSMSLGSRQLGQIPPEIGNLTNLKSLHVNSNNIKQLPPEIGMLSSLTYLYLYSNKLTQLPPEIGMLSSLEFLDISSNQLTQIPPEIGMLSNLTMLTLSYNQLTQLPPEFGMLSRLPLLYLSANQLIQLPPEIGKLSSLTSLRLEFNNLTQVPPTLGNLTDLRILGLKSNKLTQIPPEIGNLTELLELHLDSNNLIQLPPEIGNLEKLTNFNAEKNPWLSGFLPFNISIPICVAPPTTCIHPSSLLICQGPARNETCDVLLVPSSAPVPSPISTSLNPSPPDVHTSTPVPSPDISGTSIPLNASSSGAPIPLNSSSSEVLISTSMTSPAPAPVIVTSTAVSSSSPLSVIPSDSINVAAVNSFLEEQGPAMAASIVSSLAQANVTVNITGFTPCIADASGQQASFQAITEFQASPSQETQKLVCTVIIEAFSQSSGFLISHLSCDMSAQLKRDLQAVYLATVTINSQAPTPTAVMGSASSIGPYMAISSLLLLLV